MRKELAEKNMDRKNTKIILASGSPRRQELLAQIGIIFEVDVSRADEDVTTTEPGRIVEELALRKAREVASRRKDGIILGADTIVWAGGAALGKPADREDARRMIGLLQGKAHSVFTGVAIIGRDGGNTCDIRVFHRETKVHVHAMTPEEIEGYLDTGEPFDKAGAYGIQGAFAAYVDAVEGDYLTVVGLPVSAVYQELKEMGAFGGNMDTGADSDGGSYA